MSDRPGWTLVRIREATKSLLVEEMAWREEAYTTGRRRKPHLRERPTMDEVVREALEFVRAERARKNRAKKRGPCVQNSPAGV